ncbi:M24 family metallopeptidase [Tannockella kyphosi]|uniref:M24 family metallopeptidase n=1 Tax=Tannockella kyphosi TaxID=2899121 RepID=UPI002012235B|nr:Xaa-Pro peptidase family protein [Tannockella kyphosi]
MNRVEKVTRIMNSEGVDACLISDMYAIDYLLGYKNHPGERLYVLLIKKDGSLTLFLNKMFFVDQPIDASLVWYSDNEDKTALLASYLEDVLVLGVDKSWPARFLLPLQKQCSKIEFVDGSIFIDCVRMVKDIDEQVVMQEASKINDQAMHHAISLCAKDYNEKQVSSELLSFYTEKGASEFSFSPIVAFGKNAANPHHVTDESLPQVGDSIILDIGCVFMDYCSDMTRTVFYKEVSEEARVVYETVKQANLAAIAMIKPGVKLCDIDKAARDVIEEAGYGKYFTHRLGHFIGRECHEFGDVASTFDIEVVPGMIFSIEPGIYLQDNLGVRIEDLVMVTPDGCIVLNEYPKDLLIIS